MNKQILTFKELREAKGFTQESLARSVGLSRLAIARYESKQTEPKLGNFLKIAGILEVSLAELALAMGHEVEEHFMQVYTGKPACTPAQNGNVEMESMQVFHDDPKCTPAKKQSKEKVTGSVFIKVSFSELPVEHGAEDQSVQVPREKSTFTPAQNGDKRELMQVVNANLGYTPAKRRAKGKGTGFIEERVVKRGNKQYKQYWFHWQKTEPGKRRVLARSKYIKKRLVAKIIGKNNQKLPVREILRSLGVEEQ